MGRRTPLITWVESRSQISLDGPWRSIIDVYDIGAGGVFGAADETYSENFGFPADRGRHSPGRRAEYDFDTSPELQVPGDWNTQVERFHFYEGSMWFRRRFETPSTSEGRRSILYFGAANHTSTVYLNAKRLADHEGGYGPFCVEVTGLLREEGENSLIVRVDNRRRADAIPTTRTDWFNYGGLTRSVRLFAVPSTFVRDAVIQLDPAQPDMIVAEVWLDGDQPTQDVEIRIGDHTLGVLRTDATGHAAGSFRTPVGVERWSPAAPVLHDVVVRAETDEVRDRIGLRTVDTRGSEILLNGEPVFLAGISLHDEALGDPARRIATKDEAVDLLSHALALGCNFVRLAHYQHNEHTVRACDELGLMAWCEVPVYWGIDWENAHTLANATDQLTELIERDRNRAAVICWSVANETPPVPNRTVFLRSLVAHARSLDPTRLITAALFSHPEGEFAHYRPGVTSWVVDDPLGEDLDVLGVNEYHGWYYGNFEEMAAIRWSTPYAKPLIVSEFGADAKAGLHGPPEESWTEELQAEVYRHQLAMLDRIGFLAGTTPWILKDFRAPFRVLPEVQDGFNRKGLIDPVGTRKLAFDVLAAWNRDRLDRTRG